MLSTSIGGDGGIPIVIKSEALPGILAFLIATLWEFVHIEWMTSCHDKVVQQKEEEETKEELSQVNDEKIINAMRFRTSWRDVGGDNNNNGSALVCSSILLVQAGVWLLLTISIGLFLAGSLMDVVSFTAVIGGDTVACEKSYTLYSLGTALVSEFALQDNSAKPGSWTLFVSFVLFLIAAPLLVHLVHILVLVGNIKSKILCRVADVCWTFASVEVLVIAVFTVQVRALHRI